jgi:hypothetical protein
LLINIWKSNNFTSQTIYQSIIQTVE